MAEASKERNIAQSLIDMIEQGYGHRLTQDEFEEVKKGVHGVLETTDALRRVKLENSDEPFFRFVPYRREG